MELDVPDIREWTARGRASNYIHSFDEIRPGDKVVLWLRVSGRNQRRTENLAGQQKKLTEAVERRGAHVVAVVEHVGPGWIEPGWSRHDLIDGLIDAQRLARQHGAKILAESTSRYVRDPAYKNTCFDLQATDGDLQGLQDIMFDVTLVTLLHPDASASEERAFQTVRGKEDKGNPGGSDRMPGWKKRKRERLLPEAMRLRDEGKSLRDIVRLTGVPKSTVEEWLKRSS